MTLLEKLILLLILVFIFAVVAINLIFTGQIKSDVSSISTQLENLELIKDE